MAIQKDGPNGPYIGKVGSVYGYVLNGQNIIRSARKPSTKQPTPAMLLNRAKMKAANEFTTALVPCLRYGYKELAPKGSRVGPVQMAQSHIFKECIEVDAEGKPAVNPEKVYVFRGSLTPPSGCSARLDAGMLHIMWTPSPKHSSDLYKINILIYDIGHQMMLRTAEVEENKGECSLPCAWAQYKKGPLHVYIGVVDTYTGALSDSVYLGVVE